MNGWYEPHTEVMAHSLYQQQQQKVRDSATTIGYLSNWVKNWWNLVGFMHLMNLIQFISVYICNYKIIYRRSNCNTSYTILQDNKMKCIYFISAFNQSFMVNHVKVVFSIFTLILWCVEKWIFCYTKSILLRDSLR